MFILVTGSSHTKTSRGREEGIGGGAGHAAVPGTPACSGKCSDLMTVVWHNYQRTYWISGQTPGQLVAGIVAFLVALVQGR